MDTLNGISVKHVKEEYWKIQATLILLKFLGTKVHSMPIPECNLPAAEIFFAEAPVSYHSCW